MHSKTDPLRQIHPMREVRRQIALCRFLSGIALFSAAVLLATPAVADTFTFTTGAPDGLMGTATRPSSAGKIEIESADDFVLTAPTFLNSATFTGLLPSGLPSNSIGEVRVEIYRVFPKDSDVGRTSGSPVFSTPQVPTRVNSPSDVELVDRDTASGNLTFTTSLLSSNFTVGNTVVNGINPKPNQKTGGEGPATGDEVQFNIDFTTPFFLPADHYFIVPQIQVDGGEFLWLSAPKPNTIDPFNPDLQSWIRNENLAPDWLRIGTDIEGLGRTFNASFSLAGTAVPEPGAITLFASGTLLFAAQGSRRLRRRQRA